MIYRPAQKWLVLLALVLIGAGVYVWQVRPGMYPNGSPSPSFTPLSDDKIQLDSPMPGATVSSPLTITGKARGTWYFEASFPVVLTDWDGRIIAQAPAQALSDWMTTDWVPFKVTLTFPAQPIGSLGHLILKKDNPSGLPEHDDSREVLLYFR